MPKLWPLRRRRTDATGDVVRSRRLERIVIDLSTPKARLRVFLGALGALLILISLVGAGGAVISYSESSEFCGTLCHPMSVEFTRFEVSPHENVDCAHCHVGPGVEHFVRAKIQGTRQLIQVLTGSYERPIPAPVKNLRPAREICEECHTPAAFRDNVIKVIRHYANDEANSPMPTTIVLKLGGWDRVTGRSKGIHWHVANKVEYIAADEQRQVILWVGVRTELGEVKEFYARDVLAMAQTRFVEEARARGEVREMDCIDCHNRAAHYIPVPTELVDSLIEKGVLDRSIPYIRKKAVELLTPAYPSKEAAFEAIEGLKAFYQQEYPEFFAKNQGLIASTVEILKRVYEETAFPDMNVNWSTYPNNVGHTYFRGCFRCHDGNHVEVNERGEVVGEISVKCNLCHTVPIVGYKTEDVVVDVPIITGPPPRNHEDYRWTIEHRSVTVDQIEGECLTCHGRKFCDNSACHNVSHPPDMLTSHAEEYRKKGGQFCYFCHQDVLCARCHPGGIVKKP